jgi:hypothetical protein
MRYHNINLYLITQRGCATFKVLGLIDRQLTSGLYTVTSRVSHGFHTPNN